VVFRPRVPRVRQLPMRAHMFGPGENVMCYLLPCYLHHMHSCWGMRLQKSINYILQDSLVTLNTFTSNSNFLVIAKVKPVQQQQLCSAIFVVLSDCTPISVATYMPLCH